MIEELNVSVQYMAKRRIENVNLYRNQSKFFWKNILIQELCLQSRIFKSINDTNFIPNTIPS